MNDEAIAVRVPASSANLGPGFDVLGMALDLYADVGTGAPPEEARPADDHHPAMIAFRALGGVGALWVRSRIPMSLGLGYSGAVRVAGAALAALQRSATGQPEGYVDPSAIRAPEILEAAARLEGHGDNVAASQIGGVTLYLGDTVVPLYIGFEPEPAVLTWSPAKVTMSTNRSRSALPALIDRSAATFNIGHSAALALAFERGDVDLLATAMRDRLHQADRLESLPQSSLALRDGLAGGAWCGWLSGSGPTVAFLCASDGVDDVVRALDPTGRVRRLRIDRVGARVLAADQFDG